MTDRDFDPEARPMGVLPSRRRHEPADAGWQTPREVLELLRMLEVVAWRETSGEAAETVHVGPAAEDFHGLFEVGENADSIPPGDAVGVAMAAIQGLADRFDERDEQVEQHGRRIRRLEALVEEQRADLETLREQIESFQSAVSRLRLEADDRD